jgi:hypothetical protein
MSKLKIQGNASGTGVLTVTAPNTSTDRTVTLPDATGTLTFTPGITDNSNATAITIDSSENVGIGTATPGYTSGQQPGTFQTIYSSDTNGGILELASNKNTDNNTLGIISFVNTENSNSGATTRVYNAQIRGRIDTSDTNAGDDSGGVLEFQTKAEAGPLDVSMTIASDGNVGIGVVPESWTSGYTALDIGYAGTIFTRTTNTDTAFGNNFYTGSGGYTYKNTDTANMMLMLNGGGTEFRTAVSGTADTAISWTTAMTIKNDGFVEIANFSATGVTKGAEFNSEGKLTISSNTSGSTNLIGFYNTNINVGNIISSGSSTSYSTSSDYRLKENVVLMTGSIDRLKELKPSRFNFIADADTTVDGFLAHEAQEVVPEAITGTKDAMKTEEYEVTPAVMDGEKVVTEAVMGEREVPDMQGIDQSKLVPLLVASLQEAIAKIEELTTRIEQLEII